MLQIIFNFSFRNQWKIIRSVLYDKRDNCVVMATGLNFYNVAQGNFHCLKLNVKILMFLLQSSCKSAVSKWQKFRNDLTDLKFREKKRGGDSNNQRERKNTICCLNSIFELNINGKSYAS